jgi:hypothetical protein
MMTTLLLTIAVLFALLAGWVTVQAAARRTAAAHPEAGPYREMGAEHGCTHACGGCAQATQCHDPDA